MTEDRKKALKKELMDLLRAAALDATFFIGLPWVKKRLGAPVTPEDREVFVQARQHVENGEHAEARKILVHHMMSWGLNDEQILDEDLEAVVRARLATRAQVSGLEAWLAADQRRRTRFRNSLTLEATPQARIRVLADYAKMTNAQRLARLTATGKLDDGIDEIVWNWVKAHVPGISRDIWDGITGTAFPGIAQGARAIGHGITVGARAVGTAAVATNNQCDAWGLDLQAAYPLPPAPGRISRGVGRMWTRFVNLHS
jgi:hypothetical protein